MGTSESGKAESEKKIPNPQLGKIFTIGDIKYQIGDNTQNLVFFSVSPLLYLHLVMQGPPSKIIILLNSKEVLYSKESRYTGGGW